MNTVKLGIGKEMKQGGFKNAFHSMPHKQLQFAREEICRRCYWSKATFISKLAGNRPFRVFEINQLEQFFIEHNIDAWTGESLN
jgi:hypothetical protein